MGRGVLFRLVPSSGGGPVLCAVWCAGVGGVILCSHSTLSFWCSAHLHRRRISFCTLAPPPALDCCCLHPVQACLAEGGLHSSGPALEESRPMCLNLRGVFSAFPPLPPAAGLCFVSLQDPEPQGLPLLPQEQVFLASTLTLEAGVFS